jgi:hypothetical protein
MRESPTILVAVLFSVSQTARAETVVVSDPGSKELCDGARDELDQVGIEASPTQTGAAPRRARRRAFASDTVNALVECRTKPARIDVYYPDGSRLGELAFSVSVEDDPSSAALYASERIRSERFIADVPLPSPFSPAVWWIGVGGDALFSPGGIAPLAFVTLDGGYRFHRHWSVGGFVSIQPYARRLNAGGLETRLRLDQLGVMLAYHPVVMQRFDLALGVRAAAARLGVDGTTDPQAPQLRGQRDTVWLAFPAARVTLRVGLTRLLWLRLQGEVGALLPRAVVSGQSVAFGSLGELGVQAGLGLEVHFR